MSDEIVAIAILVGSMTVLLLAMMHQTFQVRELYKMFAAKVDEDRKKRLENRQF